MRSLTSLWLSAVFCVSLLTGCKTPNGSSDPPRPTPDATKPLFAPQAASLAQQKMCDEQAEKRFQEDKNSDDFGDKKKKNPPLESYTSHYDPTVNVCYVRINSISANPPMTSDAVYDAFGGREFAAYIWVNAQKKKFFEVPPTECDIDIPGKPQEKCDSIDEFNRETEKYFGVTP